MRILQGYSQALNIDLRWDRRTAVLIRPGHRPIPFLPLLRISASELTSPNERAPIRARLTSRGPHLGNCKPEKFAGFATNNTLPSSLPQKRPPLASGRLQPTVAREGYEMLNHAPVESVAEAYLELLAARGIDYFFGNGGTDFAPIIEAYAKRQVQELPAPHPIPVPHEVTAVSMAHGYTMITGRPQVVMVHTVPGTANAIGGIVNAARSNVPMLFSAGRTPITEGEARGSRDGSIHWAQESFDQAAMVREWVKWDYELRHGADLESLVDRAFAIAESPPAGPVYLTMPREVLAEEMDGLSYRDASRQQKAGDRMPTPESIGQGGSRPGRRAQSHPGHPGRRQGSPGSRPAGGAGRAAGHGCVRVGGAVRQLPEEPRPVRRVGRRVGTGRRRRGGGAGSRRALDAQAAPTGRGQHGYRHRR